VLLLDDPIDEFVFQHLQEYEKHKLINIAKADFKFPEDDVEKRKLKKLKKMYQPLTNYFKDQLKEYCESVTVS
jgi:heat shock protein beta